MEVSNTGCSSSAGSVGHSASRYCTVVEHFPGHHNLHHLQKAVLLASSRILRKVMSSV